MSRTYPWKATADALLTPGFSARPRRRESRIDKPNAPVAQGTEQRTSNPPVAGSNPAGRAVIRAGQAVLTAIQGQVHSRNNGILHIRADMAACIKGQPDILMAQH